MPTALAQAPRSHRPYDHRSFAGYDVAAMGSDYSSNCSFGRRTGPIRQALADAGPGETMPRALAQSHWPHASTARRCRQQTLGPPAIIDNLHHGRRHLSSMKHGMRRLMPDADNPPSTDPTQHPIPGTEDRYHPPLHRHRRRGPDVVDRPHHPRASRQRPDRHRRGRRPTRHRCLRPR